MGQAASRLKAHSGGVDAATKGAHAAAGSNGHADLKQPAEKRGAAPVLAVSAAAAPTMPPVAAAPAADGAAAAAAPQQSDATAAAAATGLALFETQSELAGVSPGPGQPYDVTLSGPPLPPCEAERLRVSSIGDMREVAPRVTELQNILQLVCTMFQVPSALISIFGDRSIHIITSTGAFQEGDFPWRFSMCAWTMASERHCMMIVNDALADARFCNNAAVRTFGVRFYAGAPLVSSAGHRVGTLCFADTSPRAFDEHSMRLLCNLSELVTRALEREVALVQAQAVAQAPPGAQAAAAAQQLQAQQRYDVLLRSADCLNSPVLLVDTACAGWQVLHANQGMQDFALRRQQKDATHAWVACTAAAATAAASGDATTAAAPVAVHGRRSSQDGGGGVTLFGGLLLPVIDAQLQAGADGGRALKQQMQRLLDCQESFALQGLKLPGCSGRFTLHFRCAGAADIDGAISICVPTWVPSGAQPTDAAAGPQASTGVGAAEPAVSTTPWQSLYFVTFTEEAEGQQQVEGAQPGAASLGFDSGSGAGAPPPAPASCAASDSSGRGSARLASTIISSSSYSSSGLTLCSLSDAGSPAVDWAAAVAAASSSSMTACSGHERQLMVLSSSKCSSEASAPPSSVRTSHEAPSVAAPSAASRHAGSISSAARGSGYLSRASAAAAARAAVCRKVQGLTICGHIASGSYGHVYKGTWYGSPVAVKVLDSASVLRREADTGLCLEALLGERFKHPNIVQLLAWATVTGQGKLNHGRRLWGETLDMARKPSVAQNRAAVAAGAAKPAPAAAAAAAGGADCAPDSDEHCVASEGVGVSDGSSHSLTRVSGPAHQEEDWLSAGETWLVLSYCDKGCLQDAIDRGWLREGRGGRISLLKVLVTAAEVAAAMYTLHKADVVHGDLSAYNVLLTSTEPAAGQAGRGWCAKVSDFGLAQPLGGQSKLLTKTYGTITHQSPEMLEAGVSSRANDVYAWGVLLWSMLAGSRPWAGMSHTAVVHAVCGQRRQLVFPPDTPEALLMLGQACLSYDAAERPSFQDILEVLQPLRDCLDEGLAANGAAL